jgi:F420-dependent oxidoreductase-like protein
VRARDAAAAVEAIVAAEAAGVEQVWMTQGAASPDTLGILTAAAARTGRVRLGTAIVPTYPRHPLALAQQALTLADLAPGRLRLGIGTSHRPTMEGVYGLTMAAPLAHLREYLTVVRALSEQGAVQHAGRFFTVKANLGRPARVPILISALRAGAFTLAGEIADGALSWVCPARYLLETALPALRAGAAAGRPAPPLVAHVPVALGTDRAAVLAAARPVLQGYGRLPFYAGMFADAGFPVEPGGRLSDALLDDLVVSGDDQTIADRLRALLAAGLDELMVMLVPVADEAAEAARLMRLVGQF